MEPETAVMMTSMAEVCAVVAIGKLAFLAPAATVTLAGTDAIEDALLDNENVVPPAGAAAANVNIPVSGWPPVSSRATRAREFSGAGGLNGARPVAGNGRYSGSPTFKIIHFSHRVFR